MFHLNSKPLCELTKVTESLYCHYILSDCVLWCVQYDHKGHVAYLLLAAVYRRHSSDISELSVSAFIITSLYQHL